MLSSGVVEGACAYVFSNKSALEAVVPFLKSCSGKRGVFVGLTTPFPQVISQLARQGVRGDRLFFVDYASKKVGKTLLHEQNVLFPEDLSELGVAIISAARVFDDVFVDDVSALFAYHSHDQVVHFVRALKNCLQHKRLHVFAAQQTTPRSFFDALDIPVVAETP